MRKDKLVAEKRERKGKGAARNLRQEGFIPAVFYGRALDPINLKIKRSELAKKTGGNVIFDLYIKDGEEEVNETVILKEVQRDVIKGNILHVDLQKIFLDETIVTEVPVEIVGEKGAERGAGVLQQLMNSIEVECLPLNIPDSIEIEVSDLGIGDTIQVGELSVEEGVEIITSPDEVVVTVVVPTDIEKELEEEEEEELLEPELIEEGEEEEEEQAPDEEEEAEVNQEDDNTQEQ